MQIKILDRWGVVPELFDTYAHAVPVDSLAQCQVEIWPEWVSTVPESGATPTVFINAEPNQNLAPDLFQVRQAARPTAVWLVSSERWDLAWPFRHSRWWPWWQILVHRANPVSQWQQPLGIRPWRAHALLGGYSPARWRMLEMLQAAGVLDQCLYNLQPRQPGYPDHGQAWTRSEVTDLDDPRFQACYDSGYINTMRPLDHDQNRGYLSCIVPYKIYDRSEIGIVAETGDGGSINFTEKIGKCLFYGQPFVVFGGAGTLNRLHQMGYHTFHPWINEDYDLIPDPDQRLAAVCDAVRDYCQRSDHERQQALEAMQAAVEHNRRHARNWRWLLDSLIQAVEYLA